VRHDLLIAGGGIYGAASAYFAARRGLRVLLVDRGDLAGGASSNSMRIAHGGLRYLQSLDLRRSLESIRERRRWLELAPRWVRPLACRLELRGASTAYRTAFRAGLWLNAGLVGALQRGAPREHRLRRLPYPRWNDALIEDTERVLLGLIHAARAAHPGGVEVHTYAPVERVEHVRQDLLRVHVGGLGEVEAGFLLECTGAGQSEPPAVLSMNLVVNGLSFASGREALALPHPDDRRNVFVVPWRDRCIVGTYDRAYPFDPRLPLRIESRWVDDVLRWLAPVHPELARLDRSRVRLVHAGLVPREPGSDAEPARHPILLEQARRIRVAGVKWTTAAAVAERAVELASRTLRRGLGAPAPPEGIEHGEALRAAFLELDPARREPLLPGSALRRGDLLFAVEHEWARRLDDVLLRRTGAASAGHPGRALVAAAADLLQQALDWSAAEKRDEVERFDASFHFGGNVPE
jgi:glycerol-3-phosphate dehydrogenase